MDINNILENTSEIELGQDYIYYNQLVNLKLDIIRLIGELEKKIEIEFYNYRNKKNEKNIRDYKNRIKYVYIEIKELPKYLVFGYLKYSLLRNLEMIKITNNKDIKVIYIFEEETINNNIDKLSNFYKTKFGIKRNKNKEIIIQKHLINLRYLTYGTIKISKTIRKLKELPNNGKISNRIYNLRKYVLQEIYLYKRVKLIFYLIL